MDKRYCVKFIRCDGAVPNEKRIISNIIYLKIFVFAFMVLLVCVWYYIYGVHGFYKLWKRKGLLTSSPFLFGN